MPYTEHEFDHSHSLIFLLHTPEGKTGPFDVIYDVHGGGGRKGDARERTQIEFCQKVANASGCAVVSINYRLETELPAPVDDLIAADRFIQSNAAALNLRVGPPGAIGTSFGGWLLMNAIAHGLRVRSLVVNSGAIMRKELKILADRDKSMMQHILKCKTLEPKENGQAMRDVRARAVLDEWMPGDPKWVTKMPKTIVIHSDADERLKRPHADALISALTAAHVPLEVHWNHGFNHGLGNADPWIPQIAALSRPEGV